MGDNCDFSLTGFFPNLLLLLLILPLLIQICRSDQNFTTEIIVGNQANQRAEVYRISFVCQPNCVANTVDESNLIWASPNVSGISEVKRVVFHGENAVLLTDRNGAIVLSYDTKVIMFAEEICGQGIGTHSAEVLPDGSVVVVGTYEVFFLKPTPLECQLRNETTKFFITFGHGVTFDAKRNKIYVLTYLTMEIFDLSDVSGIPRREKSISLDNYYYQPDHNENVHTADGGHDLYPLDGYEDILYLTTGERVYVYNASSQEIGYHQLYYFLPSLHGGNREFSILYKGGVKAISRDSRYQLNIIHSAPWYKELYNETSDIDTNYIESSRHLIWSFEEGECSKPDYDLTDNCKLQFAELLDIRFYKARLFRLPRFSYPYA